MKILFDECVPRRLRREFIGHEVFTVAEMKWSGKRNGELLALIAAAGIEVLLTVDRNLRYQQHVADSEIRIIVMKAFSNAREDLVPLMPQVLATLSYIKPGEVIEISTKP